MIRGDSMVDLSMDMEALVTRLEPIARTGGQGRILMFLGASRGAGASSVARAFARAAARRSRRGVWLFDLDFARNGQVHALATPDASSFDASFGRDPFWQAEPVSARARLVARPAGEHLYVTEFQRARSSIERLQFQKSRSYWDAVRGSIDMAVLDAPGAGRAVLPLAGDADGVILVADEGRWDERSIAARRHAIEQQGGRVVGIVCNRVRTHQGQAA